MHMGTDSRRVFKVESVGNTVASNLGNEGGNSVTATYGVGLSSRVVPFTQEARASEVPLQVSGLDL